MSNKIKIAVCLFGDLKYMDSFIINSWVKCIITPFQKFRCNDVEFIYYLHSYIFNEKTFRYVELMREFIPFEEIRLHSESITALNDETRRSFGIRQIRDMWGNAPIQYTLVIYLRVDVFCTRILTPSEIDFMMNSFRDRRIFLPFSISPQIDECIIIGPPSVMKIYDNIPSLSVWQRNNIMITRINLIFVRILPTVSVDSRDTSNCPYLADLLNDSKISVAQV